MLTLFVLSTGVGAVDPTQVILKTWVLVVAGEERWRVEKRRNAGTSRELETRVPCVLM
jgi:hypothetical protein